jgi:hypothetical protein
MKKYLIFLIVIFAMLILSACAQTAITSPIPSPQEGTSPVVEKATAIPEASPWLTPENTYIASREIEVPLYTGTDAIEIVRGALEREEDFSYFDQYVIGTVLTMDDLEVLRYEDNDEFLHMLTDIDSNGYLPDIYRVDIDNDGEEEMVVKQYRGGTLGIVYFAVLKRGDDGVYYTTEEFDENGITFLLNNRIRIVRLGDRNYLLVQEIYFDRKTISGVSIYSFEDGKYAEQALLQPYADGKYAVEINVDDPEYEGYINATDIMDVLFINNLFEIKAGTAEKSSIIKSDRMHTFQIYAYETDINNDGVNEYVEKSYFLTSNSYTASCLEIRIYDPDIEKNLEEEPGILQQFWCDRYNSYTITNVLLFDDESQVFRQYMYVMVGKTSKKIGLITAIPIRNITTRYNQIFREHLDRPI